MREEISEVMDDLVDAETGVRGYLLTESPDFLEPYTIGSTAVPGDLDRLGASLREDGADGDLVSLRALVTQRLEILASLKAAGEAGRTESAPIQAEDRAGTPRHG